MGRYFKLQRVGAKGSADFERGCALLSALLRSPADEFNVTEGVDAGVEGAADDGRGLVFSDNGGTGNKGAGIEVAALMDCDLDEFAGLGIENGADARGLG